MDSETGRFGGLQYAYADDPEKAAEFEYYFRK